ncbi:hypothetical protein I5A80_RS24005, partial [Escherichia coli]
KDIIIEKLFIYWLYVKRMVPLPESPALFLCVGAMNVYLASKVLHFCIQPPTFPVFIVEGRYVSKKQNSQNVPKPGAGQIPEDCFRP